MAINREFLEANHADIVTAIRSEGEARGRELGLAQGAETERDRIRAVEAQSLPGHDALIASLKFDGKTTGPEAAAQVLAAEKAKSARQLKAIEDDAPSLVPAAPAPPGAGDTSHLPMEERCKANWDRDEKVRGEFSSYEAYLAFERANAEGKIRILGKK